MMIESEWFDNLHLAPSLQNVPESFARIWLKLVFIERHIEM